LWALAIGSPGFNRPALWAAGSPISRRKTGPRGPKPPLSSQPGPADPHTILLCSSGTVREPACPARPPRPGCAPCWPCSALGGDRLVGTSAVYDLCQRLSATAAAALVVINQPVRRRRPWSLPGLDRLIAGSGRPAPGPSFPLRQRPAGHHGRGWPVTVVAPPEQRGALANSAEPGSTPACSRGPPGRNSARRPSGWLATSFSAGDDRHRPGPQRQAVAASGRRASALFGSDGEAMTAARYQRRRCFATPPLRSATWHSDRPRRVVRRPAPKRLRNPAPCPSALAAIRLGR
jgi:hypothetical protein